MIYIDPDQRPGWEEMQHKLLKQNRAEEKRRKMQRDEEEYKKELRYAVLGRRRLNRGISPTD